VTSSDQKQIAESVALAATHLIFIRAVRAADAEPIQVDLFIVEFTLGWLVVGLLVFPVVKAVLTVFWKISSPGAKMLFIGGSLVIGVTLVDFVVSAPTVLQHGGRPLTRVEAVAIGWGSVVVLGVAGDSPIFPVRWAATRVRSGVSALSSGGESR